MRRIIWLLAVALLAAGCGKSAIQESSDLRSDVSLVSPTPSLSPSPTGSGKVVVPDLSGMTKADAISALKALGLGARPSTKDRPYPQVDGVVFSQDAKPGKEVLPDTVIAFTVARVRVVVPNLYGLSKSAAIDALQKVGLKAKSLAKTSSAVSPGEVFSQSAQAGSKVKPGTVVTISVAKAAPPPPSNCTAGYSPCLPVGPSDYDCYGGSGDGPAYTAPGVVYRVTGSDPYRLDSDSDGYGCE